MRSFDRRATVAVGGQPMPEQFVIDWGDAAGWVQAVGALLVIGYTAWQGRVQLRREREITARAFEGLIRLAEGVATHAHEALPRKPPSSLIGYEATLITLDKVAFPTIDRLLETPLASWPSADLYVRIGCLRTQLDLTRAALIELQSEEDKDPGSLDSEDWIKAFWFEREKVATACDFVLEGCRKERKHLGLPSLPLPNYRKVVREAAGDVGQ